MSDALELASDFLPERKWCRELNKKNCNVFDMLARVTLWNNKATEIEIEDLLTKRVPCSWEVVEDFADTNKPFSTDPMDFIMQTRREGGLWSRQTTTYNFEMPVAGVHRVWLHKLILWGFQNAYLEDRDMCFERYYNFGFYQVGVPLLLFCQTRSSGCFKEHLFTCTRKDDDTNVPLTLVLNSFEKMNSRINIITEETP